MDLNKCDKESILSEEVFAEIFDEEDAIQRARMIINYEARAKELGVKSQFNGLIRTYNQTLKQIEKEKKERQKVLVDGVTNFTFPDGSRLRNMDCGSWLAGDDGIFLPAFNSLNDITACYHPILPVERLRNIETGEEQIVLAFKRNHVWNEVKVPKNRIASATKIVELSNLGISVTSENAKYLVKYLSDVENLNEDRIDVQRSTSKIGWINDEFIPYDNSIVFDGDSRFKNLFNAIHEKGSDDVWLDHVREIRASNRLEPKFMLASSFASVLVKYMGALPFISDLWGETEGGKTVCLMLSASVWGNPAESQYIGDFKSTDVALEAKADMLNNLPMILDDTSKTSARIRDNFEGIVYDLCSGKGKSRSNKELGINRENYWQMCILTNGEKPLNSYVNQGGAINRILEVECSEHIFDNPQRTATILKNNYGFAGRKFVNALKVMKKEMVFKIYDDFCKELLEADKMQKQAMSLALVLTADKIATDLIFCDGNNISVEEAKELLIDRSAVSDNQRCYRFLVDKVNMNRTRFDGSNCEQWGVIESVEDVTYAVFYPQALDDLCESGGFSKRSFLSWASKYRKLLTDNSGKPARQKKIDGRNYKCYFLNVSEDEEDESESEFIVVDDEKLPFIT